MRQRRRAGDQQAIASFSPNGTMPSARTSSATQAAGRRFAPPRVDRRRDSGTPLCAASARSSRFAAGEAELHAADRRAAGPMRRCARSAVVSWPAVTPPCCSSTVPSRSAGRRPRRLARANLRRRRVAVGFDAAVRAEPGAVEREPEPEDTDRRIGPPAAADVTSAASHSVSVRPPACSRFTCRRSATSRFGQVLAGRDRGERFAAAGRADDPALTRLSRAWRVGSAPASARSAGAGARLRRLPGRSATRMNCSCIDSALKHDSVVSVSSATELDSVSSRSCSTGTTVSSGGRATAPRSR